MNNYVMFGICTLISIVSLLVLLCWLFIIIKERFSWFKKIYMMIEVGVLSFVSAFCFFNNYTYQLLICLVFYFAFVFIEKWVIGLIFGNKSENKILKSKFYYLFISPDYAFTDMQKHLFSNNDENIKARLIKVNNVTNILITISLIILTTSIKTISDDKFAILWCNSFLFVRLVYRCIEIILAFTKDVLDHNKTTSLSNSIRAKLGIISFIESAFLFVGYFYKKGINDDLIFQSLSTLFFGDNKCCTVSIITAITGFVLISLVIVQYLTKEECPMLYIIDNEHNSLIAVEDMEQTDSSYVFKYFLKEVDNREFIIKYKDIYLGYNHFKNDEIQKGVHFNNFIIKSSSHLKVNIKEFWIQIE